MSTQTDIPHILDPFGTLRAMRDANLETWSKLMIDPVNSESYSQAASQRLDTVHHEAGQMVRRHTVYHY
jgi:hypothetical protein